MGIADSKFYKKYFNQARERVPVEIIEHIDWLEQQIAQILAEIKIMEGEIECVEDRLETFLNEYYGEVGRYFGHLDKLNKRASRVNRSKIPLRREAVGFDYSVDRNGRESIEVYVQRRVIKDREIKRLFYSLAKLCHPDIAAPEIKYAKEIFSEANDAYQRKDMTHLILLEQSVMEEIEFASENHVQKLERLEKKYQLLQNLKKTVVEKKQSLKTSATYELWQKVFRERARGNDLVREIKSNVMREISAKNSILAKSRAEAR